MTHINTTCKAINSKLLFKEIDEIVKDGLFSVELVWIDEENREVFLSFLNSLMQEFWANGAIEQWKVQCNLQNNTVDDMMQGIFNVDVYYKQKNCLNTTQITYTILD